MNMRVETETGWAELWHDGMMTLNNSGYQQFLTPKQDREVWSGEKKISMNPNQIKELEEDYEGEELQEVIDYGMATWNGEYWDFGEELHVIPSKEEFDQAEDNGLSEW